LKVLGQSHGLAAIVHEKFGPALWP
jgi:hypothetical protein